MEVIIHIFQQLPPIGPRLALLVVLIVLVALPQTRRMLSSRAGTGTRRLERAQKLLQVRKLEIEVAKLRDSNPDAKDSILDEQGGLIASAIPARNRWGPVFYGLLIPVLLIALAVTARMRS